MNVGNSLGIWCVANASDGGPIARPQLLEQLQEKHDSFNLYALEFVIHVKLQTQVPKLTHLQVFNGKVEGGRRRRCAHGVRWINETETRLSNKSEKQ